MRENPQTSPWDSVVAGLTSDRNGLLLCEEYPLVLPKLEANLVMRYPVVFALVLTLAFRSQPCDGFS